MGELIHGTINGYTGRGCRCPECRHAAVAAVKKWRSTDRGRQQSKQANKLARMRLTRAAEWVKEYRPDIWLQICEEVRRG